MLKIYCTFLLLLFLHLRICEAQLPQDSITKLVSFKTYIELDTSVTELQLFDLAEEWLTSNVKEFNRSNSDKNANTSDILLGNNRGNSISIDQLYKNDTPLKYKDGDKKKLVGKGVLKYTGGSMGCIRIIYFEYAIKIAIRMNKIRIEITDFNYTHYNQMSMRQNQMYGWNDEGDCNSKNSIENLLRCGRCKNEFEKLYDHLNTDMDKMINGFKTFLINNQHNEDKW